MNYEVFKPASSLYALPQDKFTSIMTAIMDANRMKYTLAKKVAKIPYFYMSDVNGTYVSGRMKNAPNEILVKTYEPKLFNRNDLAVFNRKTPNTIYLNERFLDRDFTEITPTLIHYWVIQLNEDDAAHTYSRGSNSYTPEKEGSAPYLIDYLAYKISTKTIKAFEQVKEQSKSFLIKDITGKWFSALSFKGK